MREYSFSYGFVAPPTIFVVLALLGALTALRWRRVGNALVLLSTISLYVLTTPLVASWLMERAAQRPSSPVAERSSAQAIVVLGGDVRRGDDRGIPDQVGLLTLDRIRDATRLYHSLHLPILVTGGHVGGSQVSLAKLMSNVLEEDFGVPVRWREEQSTNTYENAAFSTALLHRDGISRAIIVTQGWHMPRALWSFERAGLQAIPSSERYARSRTFDPMDLLPSYQAFDWSFVAVHELIGQVYYRWRYG